MILQQNIPLNSNWYILWNENQALELSKDLGLGVIWPFLDPNLQLACKSHHLDLNFLPCDKEMILHLMEKLALGLGNKVSASHYPNPPQTMP